MLKGYAKPQAMLNHQESKTRKIIRNMCYIGKRCTLPKKHLMSNWYITGTPKMMKTLCNLSY